MHTYSLSSTMADLTVILFDARNLKETEILGKQDPYVEVRTNQQTKTSRVHNNAGKNPGIHVGESITISMGSGNQH